MQHATVGWMRRMGGMGPMGCDGCCMILAMLNGNDYDCFISTPEKRLSKLFKGASFLGVGLRTFRR